MHETTLEHTCRTWRSSSTAAGYTGNLGYCWIYGPGDRAFPNWQPITPQSSCARGYGSPLLLHVKQFHPAVIPGSPQFSYTSPENRHGGTLRPVLSCQLWFFFLVALCDASSENCATEAQHDGRCLRTVVRATAIALYLRLIWGMFIIVLSLQLSAACFGKLAGCKRAHVH